MNNKLKTFAMAVLVTGATVTATKALAGASTNMQVLNNVSIQLRVLSQGPLSSNGKLLPVLEKALATTDLLKELANVVPGYTYKAGDKLVVSTTYASVLVTNPTPLVYALSNVNVGSAAAEDVRVDVGLQHPATTVTGQIGEFGATGSVDISAVTIGTNVVTITNTGTSVQLTFAGQAAPADLTTNLLTISSNRVGGGSTAFGSISFNTNVGYLTTITPQTNDWTTAASPPPIPDPSDEIITNYIVTTTTGTTNSVFTNSSNPAFSIMRGTTGTGASKAPVLFSATNWLFWFDSPPMIYNETGSSTLSTSNFQGTNIISKTVYDNDYFTINCFVTNGTSTNNLILILSGINKAVYKIINLEVNGTAKTPKQIFQVEESSSPLYGFGTEGGTFLPYNGTNYATNTSIFNQTVSVSGSFVDAGGVTNGGYGILNGFLTNATPVICEGTITITFFAAYPQ